MMRVKEYNEARMGVNMGGISSRYNKRARVRMKNASVREGERLREMRENFEDEAQHRICDLLSETI